jgi:DNA-directed RNA polymerase specialized sigma24 family protein
MIKQYTDEQIMVLLRSPLKATRDDVLGAIFTDRELTSKVYATINSMIKENEAIEEVRFDALMIFVRKVRGHDYKGGSNLSTFYIGICKKVSLRHIAKQRKERDKADKYAADVRNESDNETYHDKEFELFSGRRYAASLKRKIYQQLSSTCLQYFKQKYERTMSIKEMAGENDVKDQSVKNTLSRCYKKMRELILNDPEVMEQIRQNYGKL